jgi:hypothetical protein
MLASLERLFSVVGHTIAAKHNSESEFRNWPQDLIISPLREIVSDVDSLRRIRSNKIYLSRKCELMNYLKLRIDRTLIPWLRSL